MNKFTFLIYHKEYEAFLLSLRQLGVVHIETKQEGSIASPQLEEDMQRRTALLSAQHYLAGFRNPEAQEQPNHQPFPTGMALIEKVDEMRTRAERLTANSMALQKEIDRMVPWGDFDLNTIQRLEDAGYRLNFYICPAKDYQAAWDEQYQPVMIQDNGTLLYFVILTRYDELPDIGVEVVRQPERSLSDLQKEAELLKAEMADLQAQTVCLANACEKDLEATIHEVNTRITFAQVELSGDPLADHKLLMLQGWVPEGQTPELVSFLEKGQYFYEQEMLTPEDDVPIQLRNNAYTKLFEPITRMFALPNYHELDPTPFFAPFFMLFFGLCMGDGGYGLIILVACWAMMKKVAPDMRGFLKLGIYMGACTLVVGLLTGCVFGISLDSVEWSWLKGVKDKFITEKNYGAMLGGYSPMMIFAIVIGIIQILFGMGVNAARITVQFGFKYAIAKIAWLVGIISAGAVFGLPMAGISLGVFTYVLYGLLAICALFILFYNTPDKNPFLNVGIALWDTYNMATGLLGDTLSYIRLFALGLTGGILGSVFNTLAFDLTEGMSPWVRFLPVLLILLIGHGINFALCILGSFVHPMRLTFVEFYKNAGFEGGGREYKPFKQ